MKKTTTALAASLFALTLAACGGADTGSSDGSVTTQTTGTMVKTSASTIAVNGKTFNVGAAAVTINGAPKSANDLASGMRVRVTDKGGRNGSTTNDATEVENESEVKGAVTAVNAGASPQSFTIGTTVVTVDANTVYEDLTPAGFDGITVGTVVEVNGTKDASGNILATRVEGKPAAAGGGAAGGGGGQNDANEVRGAVTATGNNSISIGTTVITITPTTTFKPAATCSLASIAVGTVIEAKGTVDATTSAFTATSIECKTKAANNGATKGEVEGLITTVGTNTFNVDTQVVTWSDTTKFKKGTAADLVTNARVKAKGTLDGTTLVASEIEVRKK